MTVYNCGSTVVTDWLCDKCGHEWTTTEYCDGISDVEKPECCPKCGEPNVS